VKSWVVRHIRTGVRVGWLSLDLGAETIDPRNSPRPYFLAVFTEGDALGRVPVSGDATISDPGGAGARKATVMIDTRCWEGKSTLWVGKASELYGHQQFTPCL
jgi:hypothetical protein